jgi:hypothetical protein
VGTPRGCRNDSGPHLSRAVTHRHRRYRYGACTKVCTGAGGDTDTACCIHTPEALSRRPSPHVEGRRVGAHTHTVYSTVCMHIVRTGQEGRGTHTRRVHHRAWTLRFSLCTEMVQTFSVRTLQGDRAYTRHGQSCTGCEGNMFFFKAPFSFGNANNKPHFFRGKRFPPKMHTYQERTV